MATSSLTLKQRAYRELKEFFVIVCYLWVVFALFLLYKSVISNQGIDLLPLGLALVNALALGKIMLIAQAFHLGERNNGAPLIYPTLLKSGLFSLVLMFFKVLEEVAVGLFRHHSFQESIAGLGGNLTGILVLTVILFVLLVPFFGFTELQGVLGEDKLAELFLGRRRLLVNRVEKHV